MCEDLSWDAQTGYSPEVRAFHLGIHAFVQWQGDARSPVPGVVFEVPNLSA